MKAIPALVLLAAVSFSLEAQRRLPDLSPSWPDSTIRFTQVDVKYTSNLFSHYLTPPVLIPADQNNPAYYLFPYRESMHENFAEFDFSWNFQSKATDIIRFSADMLLGTTIIYRDSAKPYNDYNFGMGAMLTVDKKWFGLGAGGWLGRFNMPDTSMEDVTSIKYYPSGGHTSPEHFSIKTGGYREAIPRYYFRLFPVKYAYVEVRSGFPFTADLDNREVAVFGIGTGLGKTNGTHIFWAFSDLGGMIEAQWISGEHFGINGQYYYGDSRSVSGRFQAGILFRFGKRSITPVLKERSQ